MVHVSHILLGLFGSLKYGLVKAHWAFDYEDIDIVEKETFHHEP
jgi:hypothetical protein